MLFNPVQCKGKMKIALIVSLISALQIHHQTVLNVFTTSKTNENLIGGSFTIVAAAFPLGKVVGTFLVEKVCRKWSILAGVDLNGICLLLGSIISLLPAAIFLALGRFVIGIGVGCGFVLSSSIIYDFYPWETRPNAFFLGALLFGGAALYSNVVVAYLAFQSYFWTAVIVNLPSFVCGNSRTQLQAFRNLWFQAFCTFSNDQTWLNFFHILSIRKRK